MFPLCIFSCNTNTAGRLNCISINLRGINSPIKRKKVLTYLKRQSADIAFIQETHLPDLEHIKIRRDWVGHIFYSSFLSKVRGVALLINKNMEQDHSMTKKQKQKTESLNTLNEKWVLYQ